MEPGRYGADGWIEDHAGSDGAADTLREDELIVLRRDRGHHETEHMKERARGEEVSCAVVVVEETEERATNEHHEGLERHDPGDCTGCIAMQLVRFVIVLENTNTINPAKGDE